MNVAGYGQGISQMGVLSLGRQAQREGERDRLKSAQARTEEQAQGEAIGVLTGAATRAAQGVYDERKGEFDRQHADEQRAYDTGTDAYKQTHQRPEYSALDDIADAFDGVF